jgi:concanavalin A-like lectin/glucanase superfamily protein/Big-like domain-containing protein/glucose/sorbosone dehydrogenase/Calx-beta domain-containing protein
MLARQRAEPTHRGVVARGLLLIGLTVGISTVWAQYPSGPQIAKDGTAVFLRDYASLPLSSRTTGSYPPSIDFADQLGRVNFLRSEPADAPRSSSRFFVNDLNRNLYILDKTTRLFTAYINFEEVFPKFHNDNPGYGSGLVTLAFDPDYASGGRFYTIHTEDPYRSGSALPVNTGLPGLDLSGGYTLTAAVNPPAGTVAIESVLVEWTDTDRTNSVFEGTAREILRVGFNTEIHPMCDLMFKPLVQPGEADHGNLYILVGDGGAGEMAGATRTIPQRLDALPGKVLRITPDINLRPADTLSSNGRYRIPSTGSDPNPFVGLSLPGVKKEIYAYGFRDVHRISWDAISNKPIVGDIGLHAWEEVNILAKGGNYGYSEREGVEQLFVGGANGGKTGSQTSPPVVFPDPDSLTVTGIATPVPPIYPVAAYSHRDGDAISSGVVYRGSLMPEVYGKFIFGDITNARLFFADLADMISKDDGNRTSVAAVHELQVVFDSPHDNPDQGSVNRRLFDIVADEYVGKGGNAPGSSVLPGSASGTGGNDADGVPYGGGRADIRLALGGDGEIYVLSKSDGMIRQLVSGTPTVPTVAVAATDPTATEAGLTTGTFAVSRTGSAAAALTVNYTVSGSATPGSDYGALTGSVTIPAAAASAAITVTPIDDTSIEPGETVVISLTPNGAYLVAAPGSATVSIVSDDAAQSPNLVAAFGFEEGAGTTIADLSGRGNTGSLSGPTWVDGRFGKALSFDGINDLVTVNDSNSLDLTGAMTLEAWVRPVTLGGWRTLLFKERPGNLAYAIYANTDTAKPSAEITTTSSSDARGLSQLPLNAWSHVAVTYDGSALKLYVNGSQVSSKAASGSIFVSAGPLRIGGNAIWGEYVNALIDEVRIYNRVLSPGEIQADMNAPVGTPPPDTTPPVRSTGQPSGTLPAGTTQATLSLVTDEPATCRYASASGVPYGSMTNIFGTTGSTAHSTPVSGLANGGTYNYFVRCQDAANNANGTDYPISFSVAQPPPPDSTPPTVTITAPSDGATVSAAVTVIAAASDNVGVVGVAFLLDGAAIGAEDTSSPYSVSWNTRTATNGVHTLSARARDAAGNQKTAMGVGVTVSNTATGLVAAFDFSEGTGTTTVDRSGAGNTGTIAGATWVTTGRYGNALSFDGINDWVTVGDSNSLDLTTGMTLEAWVYPTALSGWRTAILKETAGGLAYSVYAHDNAPRPAVTTSIGGADASAVGTASLLLNVWTHLAATYDGATLRLYVNGGQVGTLARSGSMAVSTRVLRIGGNAVWGEYFSGRIDEVRVYNRTLSQVEIQNDMNVPIR